MKRAGLLLVGLGLSCATRCGAQDAAELELDHRIESAFVTPHTAWAKPYALGRTRVLFFTWGRGLEPREVVELNQRFDLDPKMAFWARVVDSDREHWHGDTLGVRRIDRLLESKWDAFVFINVAMEKLSTDQQSRILEAVTAGAGLVMVGVDDPRVLKAKNRIAAPASSAGGGVAVDPAGPGGAAFAILKGRGLRLPARPAIAYRPGWEVDYDLWAQRLGAGILWAADRGPAVRMVIDTPTGGVDRASLPAAVAGLRWQAASVQEGLRIEPRIRRDDGWTESLPHIEAKEASGGVMLPLPRLREGLYSVDVIARSARGVEGFASARLTVSSARRVASLDLDADWAEAGGRFAGRVALSGPAPESGETLSLGVFDRRGRELARQTLKPASNAASFEVRAEAWMPMLLTVKATLRHGDGEASSAWRFARVVNRRHDTFNFVMWDVPSGALAPYGIEALSRAGVTVFLGGMHSLPTAAAAFETAWVPYSTRILAQRDDAGVTKPCCWNDEPRIGARVESIATNCIDARRHGVFVYSLGDEGDVRGSCASPACLAAYRDYLRRSYGSVAALNASWGTSYAGFDDVRLTDDRDLAEEAARKAGNFPRWYDRQAFESDNFCRLCARFGEAFRRIDPHSICGFEGAGTFRDGDDLDGFIRSNTFWSPYPGPADEVVRSIAPSNFPHANWMGYTKDAETLLQKYWRMVTLGSDSVWWWRWEGIGRFRGWLSPTLDPYPAVKDILADTQPVRDGLGRLLRASAMQDDAVGMLYSQPSSYAARIGHGPSFGTYEGEHLAWHQSLRALGLNFRYVTDAMLRRGEADLKRFKVIVLPLTQAIGDTEAGHLRQWVEAGGTLVADVRPGIYDDHLKARTIGAMDRVFGVRRTAETNAVPFSGAVTGAVAATSPVLDFLRIRTDPGVAPDGARAAGSAGGTLYLSHGFGKGRAMLLNTVMSTCSNPNSVATPDAPVDVLRAVLAGAGVHPAVRLSAADGGRVRNADVTRWMAGGIEIVSFLRHSGNPETVRAALAGPRHVYDISGGRSLGECDTFEVALAPARARFFALSPRAIKAPSVAVASRRAGRGSPVVATVRFPGANGPRAARLDLTGPDGREADWGTRAVVCGPEGAEIALPVAWNDPPGAWTVRVVDVLTKREASCRYRVSE
jgi:hypothetical protein